MEPGNGAFDGPAAFIAAKRAAILSDGSIGPVRCDHVNPAESELRVELVAVVGLVADDALGRFGREHEAEEFLDQTAFGSVGRSGAHRHGQAFGVDQDHDFDPLADPGATNALTSALGLGEGSIHKALVEPIAPIFFYQLAHRAHDLLEHSRLDPAQEPTMYTTLGAKSYRQILPLGSVIQHPKYAGQGLPFTDRWPSSLRARLKIGNQILQQIKLLFAKYQHPKNLACLVPIMRFWDSF